MVSQVFLNMRSALRLACLEALTTKFIHGAAGLIVTTLLLIRANLSSTFVTHSVSEYDVMVSFIAFSEYFLCDSLLKCLFVPVFLSFVSVRLFVFVPQ